MNINASFQIFVSENDRFKGGSGFDPFGKHNNLARDSIYKMNEALKNLQTNNIYKSEKKPSKSKDKKTADVKTPNRRSESQIEVLAIREATDEGEDIQEKDDFHEKEKFMEQLLDIHSQLGQFVEGLNLEGKKLIVKFIIVTLL